MKDSKQLTYQYIDTQAELSRLAGVLDRRKSVAVDLEADSMHHYKEKVCLIQIATRKTCYLLDPLRLEDLSPLKPFFSNADILKIFHGADYDIRSMYRDYKITIRNLFDTELAARFLGMRETGLESVLSKYFDVRIDKKYQKKDWSRRPLPQEMLDYAAADARYLIPLANIFQRALKKKDRMAWVEEECDRLSQVRPKENNNDPFFLRFKGAGRLRPRNLAVLEELLQWRDRIARQMDLPHFKVVGNKVLLAIAQERAVRTDGLVEQRLLSRRQADRFEAGLRSAVDAALKVPEPDLPAYPYSPAPAIEPKIRKRINILKMWRNDIAEKLALDPAIVLNKTLMAIVARANPKTVGGLNRISEIKQWQRSRFGEDIVTVLDTKSG